MIAASKAIALLIFIVTGTTALAGDFFDPQRTLDAQELIASFLQLNMKSFNSVKYNQKNELGTYSKRGYPCEVVVSISPTKPALSFELIKIDYSAGMYNPKKRSETVSISPTTKIEELYTEKNGWNRISSNQSLHAKISNKTVDGTTTHEIRLTHHIDEQYRGQFSLLHLTVVDGSGNKFECITNPIIER